MSITIDSTMYDIPIKVVNRKADTLYKYAERTEDGVLHSELIGVYYNYDLECGMSANNVTDYAALWLKLTEPVESHTIVLPDESDTLTFDCYFANVRDEVTKTGATNYFRNLSFSVIAISPARTP
jgi:hypothetical protein